MATRSQVLIHSSGLSWTENPCLLYHHWDGYPENMLQLIEKAFNFEVTESYIKGRVGKVASLLCAVDPAEFEPKDRIYNDNNLCLHSDIEFFYDIEVINPDFGCLSKSPTWVITVYITNDEFWDEPYLYNMRPVKILTLCG